MVRSGRSRAAADRDLHDRRTQTGTVAAVSHRADPHRPADAGSQSVGAASGRDTTRGHNTPRPQAGTVSPAAVSATPLPMCAFDWSIGHGIHATFDGTTVRRFRSSEELLDDLAVPHLLVAEATFESWDAERRRSLAERIEQDGHTFVVFRPLRTGRHRRATDGTKSDHDDALAIWEIATQTRTHLYPFKAQADPQWVVTRSQLNQEYNLLRKTDGKQRLITEAAELLGPVTGLSDDARTVLTNGRDYRPSLLAAVYFSTLRTRSREEFERVLGLSGAAYPSLLRSDVHHHAFRWYRAACLKAGTEPDWAMWRREVRGARRRILDATGALGSNRHAGRLFGDAALPPLAERRDDAPNSIEQGVTGL